MYAALVVFLSFIYIQISSAEDYSDVNIIEDELPGLNDAKGFIRGT